MLDWCFSVGTGLSVIYFMKYIAVIILIACFACGLA